MKKILKTIGKVVGWFFAGIFGILALLCVITLCWAIGPWTAGTVTDALPTVPQDFVPTVRLIAFTDPHNMNDRVAGIVDKAYELYDNDPVYPGVDGIFGIGDFTSVGLEGDYANYTEVLFSHVRSETPCINVLGNHEFKVDYYDELFVKYFPHEPDTVTDIKGFTCIGFSGDRGLTEWTFTPASLKWLSDAIDDAEATADGKPIFVFAHPHPFGTVYGSTVWNDFQLNPIYAGKSNIITFTGHSHFPMNDPRSINQNTYTVVGCGACRTFELDINGIVGQHPDGYDTAYEMCVIEANDTGSVRIRGYDVNSDTYFCDYFIENVNDRSTFAYTYKNMKAHDTAPVFPENTAAKAFRNENGEWVISFSEAHSSFIVHEYKVTIRDEKGKKIFSKNFINDYYVIDDDDTADFRIGTDTLESGRSYTLEVRAESAYHKYSDTIKLPFTAQ